MSFLTIPEIAMLQNLLADATGLDIRHIQCDPTSSDVVGWVIDDKLVRSDSAARIRIRADQGMSAHYLVPKWVKAEIKRQWWPN